MINYEKFNKWLAGTWATYCVTTTDHGTLTFKVSVSPVNVYKVTLGINTLYLGKSAPLAVEVFNNQITRQCHG